MEELIYDRTQQDVNNKTNKGYHNYTDLNRIEEWCEYLANLLTSYGYVVRITVKKDWSVETERTATEIERIRNNVRKIKAGFYSLSSTPQMPSSLDRLDYKRANDIEKILFDIDYILGCLLNNFVHSGVANSGQNRLWQQRFRRFKVFGSQPYKVSQYDENDTWETISDSSSDTFSRTNKLNLPQFTSHNKVGASLNELNSMFETISGLVGDISE